MASYVVNKYNGSQLAIVADGTANTSATSLTLIGHSLTNYGTALNENFVYLLENFSNSAGNYPLNPLQGQLWWDNTYKYLNVYDGTTWRTVYGALSSLTVNTSVAFTSITTTNGGQVSGYLTGAIGANVANSGVFTTVNVNTTLYAATVNASVIGNSGATFTGATLSTTSTITAQGTIAAPTVNANVVGNVGSSHYGTIATNAQPFITSVGTLSGLVTSGNITAQTANVYAANLVGNTGIYSAAYFYANGLAFQGGVTSVAAGANVTVSGTGSGPYTGAITINIPQSVAASATPSFAGITSSGAITPTSNASINIGTTSAYWNNVYAVNFLGTSTTAKYADLAEKYLPDADYDIGTVMMVGGVAEVTQHSGAKIRAIGVISAYPAYKMNSDLEGGVYVALKGRVPVKVIGPVTKGQALIGTAHGLAVAQTDDSQWMFAIALQDYNDNSIGLVEAVIL